MKDSYKRGINFGILLNKLNFNRKNHIHNNQTFDKNSSFRKDCSSLNIIKPEIEYVTKLDFFIPNTPNLNSRKKSNSSVENRIYENKLENRRKELESKIFKIKEDLKPLNDELTKIISEIDNLKLDYEILHNNKTCSIIEKTIKKNLMINTIISPRDNMNYLPFLLKRNNLDKKNKIDSILSQHKKKMRSKKNYTLMKATQLKEQKKEIVNKIKSYETDLKIFREEKNKIKNELLSHYNTILHQGKDIRKDGLSWIIQAIWNLKCKVLPSYLPMFLDEESISFLFNFAKKKNKLNDLVKLAQKLSKKINEDKNKNKNNEYLLKKTNTIDADIYYRNTNENFFEENKENNKWAFSTLMHKFNLHNNINNINTNEKLTNIDTDRTIKKANGIDIDNNKENDMKSLNSKNSNNNSNNNNKIRNSFSFNKMVFKTCSNLPNFNNKEKIELYNDKNIIEKNIHVLKKEIKDLIENELQRLNQCFDKEGYESKYNIDKNKFINTVIGENNIKDEINKQISNRKNFLNILKKIKIANTDE